VGTVVDLDNQINATLSLMSPAEFAKRRKETDFEAFGRSGSQTNCSSDDNSARHSVLRM